MNRESQSEGKTEVPFPPLNRRTLCLIQVPVYQKAHVTMVTELPIRTQQDPRWHYILATLQLFLSGRSSLHVLRLRFRELWKSASSNRTYLSHTTQRCRVSPATYLSNSVPL
ncbi:hypothetical protein SKAU_G00158070 [Synaphobranchus kaupii]|uniref:Uncharacterized protein n=1 Tax=Synaphobranchus kaupii TaxID=118154 RepID=A0A9Q1IZL7_SYNKA|nr:hypothetical protein SKAU_G00158070 [Synaphobranchus kaupii]